MPLSTSISRKKTLTATPDAAAERQSLREYSARAAELYCEEALAEPPQDGPEPFSLDWFLAIERRRYCRRNEWISKLLGFNKHAGETLLGVGDGLGTDWLQYARQGANVIACSSETPRLQLIRRHFELRELKGRFLHVSGSSLPLADATVDVVCINSLLPEPATAAAEIFRVLKPGGKVLAVVTARYGVDFWKQLLFPWTRLYAPQATTAGSSTSNKFSRRGSKRLFSAFDVQRIHKRHIRRRDIPLPFRWLPSYALHRLVGQFLIVKAFKPISIPAASSLAA